HVREAALAELDTAALGTRDHDRVAGTEDPAVHHLGNRQEGRGAEGLPQIGGLGIAETVALEIEPHPFTKDLAAEVLLEHAEDRGALLVGEEVEHRLAVAGMPHLELDGPGVLETVYAHRSGPRYPEGGPPLPLGLPGVDGEQLHERGEGLVQPDAVPPEHGHQVAEP